jgi:hypothetical protein
MAKASGATETPEQLINIELIIITRATIFTNDIRAWNEKLAAAKTWPKFKRHLRTAQKAIKRSQPLTTTDTLGYHRRANAAKDSNEAVSRISLSSNNAKELTVAGSAADATTAAKDADEANKAETTSNAATNKEAANKQAVHSNHESIAGCMAYAPMTAPPALPKKTVTRPPQLCKTCRMAALNSVSGCDGMGPR